MNRRRGKPIFYTVCASVLIIAIFLYIKHTNPSTDSETVMVCLAIFTAVAFFLEYHQNSLLNEAQFVIDLNNQFLNEGNLGMQIAVGHTVEDKILDKAFLSWDDVSGRIQQLLNQGEYAPQVVLDVARENALHEHAEALSFMESDMAEGVAELVFDEMELFPASYPDRTERISEYLSHRENVLDLVDRLEGLAAAYEEDPSVMRFRYYAPDRMLARFQKFAKEAIPFEAREGFAWNEHEIHEAMTEILNNEGLDDYNTWEVSFNTIMEQSDGQEKGQHKTEPTLTYYVAENSEFPSMGVFHETEKLEEAIELYNTMPSNPDNGIKGIGINLNDGSSFSGMYPLFQEGKGVSEMGALGEYCMHSPLVQQAYQEVTQRLGDQQVQSTVQKSEQREPEQIGEKTDTINPKQLPTTEKQTTVRPGGRKESILNALRERQTKIKDREQQERGQKKQEKKKGDISL